MLENYISKLEEKHSLMKNTVIDAYAELTVDFIEMKERSSHTKGILGTALFAGISAFPVTFCKNSSGTSNFFTNIGASLDEITKNLTKISFAIAGLMIAIAFILYMSPAISSKSTENALQILKRAIIGCVALGALGGLLTFIKTVANKGGGFTDTSSLIK